MTQAALKIFGNILDILHGRVEHRMLRAVSQAHYRFALGGASFSGPEGIGETMVIDGTPHVCWVEEGRLHHALGVEARSPFLMGLDLHQKVGNLLAYKPSEPTSLDSLYGELAKKHPKGVALVGSVQMTKLFCTYLKAPPIHHQNINEFHDTYWEPTEEYPNVAVCLFGVVIPPEGKRAFPPEVLGRAFYDNPLDVKKAPFFSHTHAAFVDRVSEGHDPEQLMRDLGQAKVSGVRHVLNQSFVKAGTFACFSLGAVVAE